MYPLLDCTCNPQPHTVLSLDEFKRQNARLRNDSARFRSTSDRDTVITGFIVARNIGKKYMYETGNY